jgi:hypothetical protein
VDGIAVGDRAWLFVSEEESSIADILTMDGDAAELDVPNWAMTRHVHEAAVFPWLYDRWQARDIALLLDRTKTWRCVTFQPTDADFLIRRIRRCAACGLTVGLNTTPWSTCPKCPGTLQEVDVRVMRETGFPPEADEHLVEIRTGGWDHEHCLICESAIGQDVPRGYRESSFAGGPNSIGVWLCEACFERYAGPGDFSFLLP